MVSVNTPDVSAIATPAKKTAAAGKGKEQSEASNPVGMGVLSDPAAHDNLKRVLQCENKARYGSFRTLYTNFVSALTRARFRVGWSLDFA